MAQKLYAKDVNKKLTVNLDKSIRVSDEHVNGYMTFGEKNDYPELISRLIENSPTGKAVSTILAKFLTGEGFENKEINNIVIGKDQLGREITVINALRFAAFSMAKNNGFYFHTNVNLEGVVGNIRPIPFKNCRFSKMDDAGYCSKIGVYDNWVVERNQKFEKDKINWYSVFNNNTNVIASQMSEALSKGEKYKGQIFFYFSDSEYLYPLSPFDSCYLDLDTESQIQLFQNREVRDGFKDAIIIRTQNPANEQDARDLHDSIMSLLGADAPKILHLSDEIDPQTNEIKESGAFKIDSIKTNINDKLFESWTKDLSNKIRKCVYAVPQVLIEHVEGSLGNTSGESIIQATNYYNAMTRDFRAELSESFRVLLSSFDNEILRANTNWNIAPLQLLKEEIKDTAKIQN